jgi:DNA-binding PucR family transcriptional regulator
MCASEASTPEPGEPMPATEPERPAAVAVPDTAAPGRPAEEPAERLRSIHLEMVDAVLSGEGLPRVAELAGREIGARVAIVVPRLGVACAWPPPDESDEILGELDRYVADRVRDRPAQAPATLREEIPISAGDELIGSVVRVASADDGSLGARALEFLHLAAVASLTEVAVFEAREEVEQNLRGSFMEELRARTDLEASEIVRRAGRLGCDLSRGAVVLCAELTSERPAHLVAVISGDYPGALAQLMDAAHGQPARIYALLPAVDGERPGEATLGASRKLATRLGRHGPVGLSSFYTDPGEIGRAMQEAELVVDVLRQSDGLGGIDSQDIGTGTYRLLFRVLASHPEEVRSFYEDTVAPIVRYDDQYRTDLVGTLEAYLEQNCNMNATATAIYAHRHTVAYRLDRVRELTGLDPMQSEDRERLGLGLKAYRIIAPRLPR